MVHPTSPEIIFVRKSVFPGATFVSIIIIIAYGRLDYAWKGKNGYVSLST